MRFRSKVGGALLGALLTAVLLVVAAPAMASVSPPTAEYTLNPGASATDNITVTLASQPPKVDVLFSFDLTGSMGDILDTAKAKALGMMTALKAAYPTTDFTFGAASHMDYPHTYTDFFGYTAAYGDADSGDYAYKLDAGLNGDTAVTQAAINAMTLGDGEDGPEDYTRAFFESYADSAVGWRDGAQRILVHFGDNVPHDNNLNEGVTTGTWSTGGDPGRDELQGTADDLDLQTVLAAMMTNHVELIECHSSTDDSEYWTYWTGLTDGAFLQTDSDSVIDDVIKAVGGAITTTELKGLHIAAQSGYEGWLTAVDPASKDVTIDPVSGATVDFAATLTVPAGTAAGDYTFKLSALDATLVGYGDQAVTIHVPGSVEQPPVVAADKSSVTVDEGKTATNTGTWSDPNSDAVALKASVGSVVENADGTWSWSYAATDGPGQSQTVTITADDGRGGVTTTSFALTVNNVTPTIGAITWPLGVVAGKAAAFSASFSDPGSLDTHTAVWDRGDGTSMPGTVAEAGGSGSVTDLHTYAIAGSYTVTCTVTDKDGGVGSGSYRVTVLSPTATWIVMKGSPLSLKLGATVTLRGWVNKPVAGKRTVTIWRKASGTLHLLKTLTLTKTNTFSWAMKPAKTGTWVFVARYKPGTVPYTSLLVTVKVHK